MKHIFYILCYILLATALVACGKQRVEPEVQPYLSEIESLGQAHGRSFHVDYDVTFSDSLPALTRGECNKKDFGSGSKEIVINRKYWNAQNADFRKALLLHEIGHCTFDKGHNDEKDSDRPKSLMYFDSTAVAFYYSNFEEEYLKEFFQ